MKTNWRKQNEKKQREELINFLYEQNQQISNDKEKLLVDIAILQVNKELYESLLVQTRNRIYELQELADFYKATIEQTDRELQQKIQEQKDMEEDIKEYYQELIDSES